MITEITKAQLLTWRLGVLKNEGRDNAQISMAKETMSTWQLTLHVRQDKY
jgi:glutaryl-CoA dehydrogenase